VLHRYENVTGTSLDRTATIVVPGSSDEPDSQPSGSDRDAAQPSLVVPAFRRSPRALKQIKRWPDNEWTINDICNSYPRH